MPTTTGMVSSFSAIRSRGLLQEMREETRMEMMSTRKRKLVPHRGWNRGNLLAFSTVSSSPAS